MWAKVRTILVVTIVTCLIWIWADAETQRGGDDLLRPVPDGPEVEQVEFTIDTLPVRIAFPAASGKLQWERVRLESTEFKRVTVVGPRPSIERIRSGDLSLSVAALLVLDDRDLAEGTGSVSKSVELTPGGLGLRFVGPAPTARVLLGR